MLQKVANQQKQIVVEGRKLWAVWWMHEHFQFQFILEVVKHETLSTGLQLVHVTYPFLFHGTLFNIYSK